MSKKQDKQSLPGSVVKNLGEQYKVPRDEFFSTKKIININVDRKDYVAIKTLAFEHKISMMKLFERLVQEIVRGSPLAKKIVNDLIEERFQKELARLEASAFHPRPPRIDYSSIDSNKLYDLISERLNTKNNKIEGEK